MLGHLLLVVLIIIQSRGKCLKGSAFLHVVIMGIDLLRGKKIGMAEPFLDVFHQNSLVAEKSCTAMTEIMESDMWHVVIIKKSFETCRNPVRSYQIPVFEDIDIVIEFVVVSVSEEKFHLLLALELTVRFREELDAFLLRKGERGLEKAFVHWKRDLYGLSGLLGDNLHCYYLDSHCLSSFQENRQVKKEGRRCLSIRSCSPNQADSPATRPLMRWSGRELLITLPGQQPRTSLGSLIFKYAMN